MKGKQKEEKKQKKTPTNSNEMRTYGKWQTKRFEKDEIYVT